MAAAAVELLVDLLQPHAVSDPTAADSPLSHYTTQSHIHLLTSLRVTPSPLQWGFLLACGAFWTITYLLLILTAYRTRTTGMPYFALALNLTWEVVFALILPHPWPQRSVDVLWLTLDCVILVQTLVYFPYSSPPLHLSRRTFLLATLATLVTSLALNYAWTVQLADEGAYSAFVSNLYMSVAFVVMYVTRQPRGAGQSVWVAVSKMAGTSCSSVAFYLMLNGENVLLNVVFVSVFVWDALYVALLVHHRVQETRQQQQAGDNVAPLLRGNHATAGMVMSRAALTESSAAPPHKGRAS